MLRVREEERYTPITLEIQDILWAMHREWGGWRAVSAATGVRKRMLWRIREGEYKCVSEKVLDRLLTNGLWSLRVEDFDWYTVDELVEMGVWEEKFR
jgi:hypothetical protein